ncbi:MAG: hypothetical protein JWQ73_3407, partial [Variovorax sp.]|nr:hypothetical protein [Variovorax sp.]
MVAISAVGFSGRLTSAEVNNMGVFIKERAARVEPVL